MWEQAQAAVPTHAVCRAAVSAVTNGAAQVPNCSTSVAFGTVWLLSSLFIQSEPEQKPRAAEANL